MIRYHDAWRLIPRKFRAIDTVLHDDERAAIWGKGGADGDDERFWLWSDFWPGDPGRPRPSPRATRWPATSVPTTVTDDQRQRLARALTPSWFAGVAYFGYRPRRARQAGGQPHRRRPAAHGQRHHQARAGAVVPRRRAPGAPPAGQHPVVHDLRRPRGHRRLEHHAAVGQADPQQRARPGRHPQRARRRAPCSRAGATTHVPTGPARSGGPCWSRSASCSPGTAAPTGIDPDGDAARQLEQLFDLVPPPPPPAPPRRASRG